MKTVFADTFYWIAVSNPHDPWHAKASTARTELGNCQIITTDSVLVEYLTTFSGQGEFARRRAVATVEHLLSNSTVRVVAQTRQVFLQALALYKNRVDKAYSLTDCISMNIMREEGILEILTNDHHFIQEGFTVLIQR